MPWRQPCIRPHEPLANHTSFRIGGPAEWFAQPSTLEELIAVLRQANRLGVPVSVLGGGTNTLAADRGIGGVVIRLGRAFQTVEIRPHPERSMSDVRCGAALLTQRIVTLAEQHGWGGLERLAGLPGQLGGAVAMNAQSIGQFVQQVTLVALDGAIRTLARDQLRFRYRYTTLEPGIVTEVTLRVPIVPVAEAVQRIRQALAYRNTTQEVGLPSAGCAFKNPAGDSAGRLLDRAGLKGSRIGDAQVSARHANFIVNVGRATCDDVLSLMEHMQRQVWREFHLWLEPEVRLIGERLG